MVAQLDDRLPVGEYGKTSLELVVDGPDDNRSRGLCCCVCTQTPRYDHKRQHAVKAVAETLPDDILFVWNFKLVRDDGTCVYLHPNFTNPQVEGYFKDPAGESEPPRSGKDGSNIEVLLRFDPTKKPQHSQQDPPQDRQAAVAVKPPE